MRSHQRRQEHHHNVAAEARERIAEIGEILATGLIRLRARQSSQMGRGSGESSLASLAHQSGHENAEPENGR